MTADILLSFCIPTYNRANYLNETLNCICKQIPNKLAPKIEICISDNASEDETVEIVQKFRHKAPVRIVYNCNEYNLGADLNYLKAVEMASGKYCWLFGSDDMLVGGAVGKVLSVLANLSPDIIVMNRIECDIHMKPLSDQFWLKASEQSKIYYFEREQDFLAYLNKVRLLGALFSYLTSIVFLRERWNEIKFDNQFIGTAYSHVYILLSMVLRSCRLFYQRDRLILCRGGNDSFAEEGRVKRILLDFEGYTLLADTLITDNLKVKQAFFRAVRRNHPFWKRVIMGVRGRIEDQEMLERFTLAMKPYYRPIEITIFHWSGWVHLFRFTYSLIKGGRSSSGL